MTPDEYRALAARVETEAPSRELQEAIMRAFGWEPDDALFGVGYGWRVNGGAHADHLPNPLTSIDAAAAPMPEGWNWSVEYRPRQNVYLAIARRPGDYRESLSTTEPQARTALALRCKAADLEARGDD